MVSPMGFRGDGASRAESCHQHRRAKSAVDGFHHGFVKRLAGILDDHTKLIKNNSDFLKEVSSALRSHSHSSSTLRSHSCSSLPRPVYYPGPFSEPSLKFPAMSSPSRKQEDTSAVESSPGSMPPTPPDTPIVEITDWSTLPEKPTSTKSSIPPPESIKSIMASPESTESIMAPPESTKKAASNNQGDASDDEIETWYRFHAARAAKSLRYDCREVELKLGHFIHCMNDLTIEINSLSHNTHPNLKLTRKELSIRDTVQQEVQAIRQTLHHYRKSRVHHVHLATTTASEVMPGLTYMEPNVKLRALHKFYCHNKEISKPGDRKRYNHAMEILDACMAKDLNEEFVQKIDKWDQQVAAMKGENGGASIV